MQKRLLSLAGSILIVSGMGCADATAPQVRGGTHDLAIVVPQLNAAVTTNTGGLRPSALIQPPDSSGDSNVDWNAPTSFVDKWTDAGFDQGVGYSQGYMEFYGTNYDEKTTVYLNYQNSPLDHRDNEDASSFWWPLSSHKVTVNANITPGGSCDYAVSGHTTHHIWNSGLKPDGSYMTWADRSIGTDSRLVSQALCSQVDTTTTVTSGSTGGSETGSDGGTIYVICYWTNYYEDGVMIQHEDDGCQVLG